MPKCRERSISGQERVRTTLTLVRVGKADGFRTLLLLSGSDVSRTPRTPIANRMKRSLIPLLLLAASVPARSAVTYVDASTSNTLAWNGSSYGTFTTSTSSSGTDGLWRARTGLANPYTTGTVFESAGATGGAQNTEDAPRLATTITGLTVGSSYAVYAYFWGAGSPNAWKIQAGLSDPGAGNNMTVYTQLGGGGATQVTATSFTQIGTTPLAGSARTTSEGFTSTILIAEVDRLLFRAALGTAVADGSGSITVYIDDDTAGRQAGQNPTTSSLRTWYDGVGVEAVPEPSAALLGLLGTLALFRRRR